MEVLLSAQQDKAFYKVFVAVIGILVCFTFSIATLANVFSPDAQMQQDPLVQAKLQQRITPIGQSRVAE